VLRGWCKTETRIDHEEDKIVEIVGFVRLKCFADEQKDYNTIQYSHSHSYIDKK